jgi:hypothetical protein
MPNLALVTANRCRIVESLEQMTLPGTVSESLAAGDAVRIDTTTGRWTKANGTSAGEARIYGVLTDSDNGINWTAVRRGVLDGFDLDDQDYDDAIYLSDTDGTLADAAGTVSVLVGRVIPATGTTLGTAYDKLLLVNL